MLNSSKSDLFESGSVINTLSTVNTNISNAATADFGDAVKTYKFDECCQGLIDVDSIVMEGYVNVRRKLFFYKRRQLLLIEDGTLYILKHGHINNQLQLNSKTQID